MKAKALIEFLDGVLKPGEFRDYAPNGLQVEGRENISSIVLGVSASLGLLEAAAAKGADAVLVHHGWFWRGEDARIVGVKGRRIRCLIENGRPFSWGRPINAYTASAGARAPLRMN